MNVVAEGRYGGVVRIDTGVLYVPTASNHRLIVSFADEEDDPPLRRRNAPASLTAADGTAAISRSDVGDIEGVIRFRSGSLRGILKAGYWVALEDAVGPLRYRTRVEHASIHNFGGYARPMVPLRIARSGTGAIYAYFRAHDHPRFAVSRELPGTLRDVIDEFEAFVEGEAPSFPAVEDLWPA